ncbi:hypothetical protein CRUP_010409 [Coryphaenoides rupestris]|nr:hypothetical protein CRUP_010409 [Coryphaenoides rupestris]
MQFCVQIGLLIVTLCSVQSFVIKAPHERSAENAGNLVNDEDFSVSTLLERANLNVGKGTNEPLVMFGDIAVETNLRNADPCIRFGCLWPKASDGNVYVPFRISEVYSQRERATIKQGLDSFALSTCVRFTPLNDQRDFVDIQSLTGCFSFVGRQRRGQPVSLSRQGCVFRSIIQHELLHALGFNHEQTRSDRDEHVRILLNNVIPGQESNFRRINTINLGTPYDYNSVMHYGREIRQKNR